MHKYDVFGLTLHSDLELPGVPAGGDQPDIEIRLQKLEAAVLAAERDGGMVIADRLYYEPLDSDVLFEIREGRSIRLQPLAPIDDDVLRGWVTGIFMAALLRQRGLLVLHASAVARDGEALVFVGGSGWGKSTLAGYFHDRGYEVLSDDVIAIDLSSEGAPTVSPSFPSIRLREGAGKYLVRDYDALPTLHAKTSRRYKEVPPATRSRYTVRKVYVLDNAPADAEGVDTLPNQLAALHLITHTRAKDMLVTPAFRARHLAEVQQLLERVPVGGLRRVRSLDRLQHLYDVIEADAWPEVCTQAHG